MNRDVGAGGFGFLGAKGRYGRPPVIPPGARDMRNHEGREIHGLAGDLYREMGIHRPELRELVDRHGNTTCLEYGAGFFRRDCGMSSVLVDALRIHAERLHGQEVSHKVADAARLCSSIATGEHAAFLGDPIQFQSALMLSAGAVRSGMPAVISLPFGNVPLDNRSTRSGSIAWKGQHYRLTSNRRDARRALTYGSPSLTRASLSQRFRNSDSDAIAHMFPHEMFAEHLEFLTDQFVVANRILWDQAFGDMDGMAPFIQIPAEELVATLLAESFAKKDFFHRLIFDRSWRAEYLWRFEGIRSCHRSPPQRRPFGTHLFWGRSETSGRQLHYFLDHGDSDVLKPYVSVERTMTAPAAKHAARELRLEVGAEDEVLGRLADRSIVPGVFLSLTLLAAHGATNNGGYQQTDYFKRVRHALIAMMRDRSDSTDLPAGGVIDWEHIKSGGFCLGPLFLLNTCLRQDTSPRDEAASLDALWGTALEERRDRVFGALRSVTFRKAALAGATRFYPSIVQETGYARPELTSLRVEDVLNAR